MPRHWLGVVAVPPAAAPVSVLEPLLIPVLVLGEVVELVLPPTLEPVLELGVLIDGLLDVPLVAPADVPALPLDWAHEAPATATNAAATAVAIVLTITIESPWSVEE